MQNRRQFLTVAASTVLAPLARGQERVFLAAHRGGVVDAAHPENSPASIAEAVRRGYWMIEVDVRATRDGVPVLQHDATFSRYYDDSREVSEMTWAEVRTLRSNPGNHAPMHFEEMCELASGKLRLMLDLKGDSFAPGYLAQIEAAMRNHGLLEGACTLGGGAVKEHFRDKILLSANRQSLREAVARGEDVARRYFLFELGSVLDEEAYALCQQHKVLPMAAINQFRYEMAKVDHWRGAEADIRRLRALGVRHFQIDSMYDRFLL